MKSAWKPTLVAAMLATSPMAFAQTEAPTNEATGTATTAPDNTAGATGGADTTMAPDNSAGGGAEATQPGDTEGELVSMEEALGAIENDPVSPEDIAALGSDVEVRIVLMSELQGGVTAVDANAIRQAISEHEQQIADLRAAIATNTGLSGQLTNAGHAADAVFAVAESEGGEIRVFVDDGDGSAGTAS